MTKFEPPYVGSYGSWSQREMVVRGISSWRPIALLIAVVLTAGWPAVAGNGRPFLELRPTATPPVVDGKLDDACWQEAPVLTNFAQVVPVEGAPPSEATEARFLYNRDWLFVGLRCYDREPHKIIGKQMLHDAALNSDDYVKLAFDPFNRQRDGYFFAVNPAGVRVEGQIQNFASESKLWDTVWQARARTDAQGWTAELAIPFRSLSFDRFSAAWGVNLERVIRRKQEVVRWTALSPAKPMAMLADFGELRGLTNLHQGLGLEFKPFTSVKWRDEAAAKRADWDLKPGFDLTYSPLPSLTAQATFNTDFAEAEVDDRQVNLTRFPLFFPEKRDFFLRDAPLFSFGGLGYSPLPFYSRRIGLGNDGRPVDLLAGGRLSGRLGGTSVALLDVQQQAHNGLRAKNLAVARISAPVFGESNAGFIGTRGDPLSNGDAMLGGLDFNYLNSRLPGGRQLVGHAYVLGSTSDRLGGPDLALGVDLDYPNEPLDVHLTFKQIGEKFEPALGFIERRGIREYRPAMFYLWRPNTAWVRSVSLGVAPEVTTDLANHIVARDFDVPMLTITAPSGDSFYFEYSFNRDRVDAPFDIWPGVRLPARDYDWGGYKFTLRSSEARPLSAQFTYRGGTFYSGTRTDYFGALNWRPSRHLTLGTTCELRQARLAQGDFDVRLASARLNLALTPDLSWNLVAQYDNLSQALGFNSRIRWTFRPGNDLFLVFNQGYLMDQWHFQRLTSELTLKAGLTFRF